MKPRELDIYIDRFLKGDKSAFEIIYNETKKPIYLSIYTIIKNPVVIEDLMQDAYLKIINSLEYYKSGTNFLAWVSKIARNIAINYYNYNKKQILVDASENEHLFGQTNKKEYLLDDALSILEGYEKDIFTYRIVMDFTLKEISNILGMPISTIHYMYKNTMNKIKKHITGDSK